MSRKLSELRKLKIGPQIVWLVVTLVSIAALVILGLIK